MKKIIDYFKQGKVWFATLIVSLLITATVYFLLHLFSKNSYEAKTLSVSQLQVLTILINKYQDTTGTKDTAAAIFAERDAAVICYIKGCFGNDSSVIQSCQFLDCGKKMSNAELLMLLPTQSFKVKSFFWFIGYQSYLEVLFWTLFGVLTSLVFYVGIANKAPDKESADKEIIVGKAFNYREIYDHLSKMVYAPVCTLVIIIGYDLIKTNSMTYTVTAGNGMLMFSFISGFYSGRLMKFLDKLKDVILPVGGGKDAEPTQSNPPANPADAPIKQEAEGQETAQGYSFEISNLQTLLADREAEVSVELQSIADQSVIKLYQEDNPIIYSTDQLAVNGQYKINMVLKVNDVEEKYNTADLLDITESKRQYSVTLIKV